MATRSRSGYSASCTEWICTYCANDELFFSPRRRHGIKLDPAQLVFKEKADGGRSALCGTAIATRANVSSCGWCVGPNDPEVLLTEFADEDNTLTYFRTPYPQSELLGDDELLTGPSR